MSKIIFGLNILIEFSISVCNSDKGYLSNFVQLLQKQNL